MSTSTNCITKIPAATPSISINCPYAVLEGKATMILKNVTKAMDDVYECGLSFSSSASLSNSTSLRVVSECLNFLYPYAKVMQHNSF